MVQDEYYMEDLSLIDRLFGQLSDWTYRIQIFLQIAFLFAWFFTLSIPYFFLLCICVWVFEFFMVLKIQTTMSLFILQSSMPLQDRTRAMFLTIANMWAQGILSVYGYFLVQTNGMQWKFESILGLYCVLKVLLIFVYLFLWHCAYITRGFTFCYTLTQGVYDFFRTNPIRRFVQRNRTKCDMNEKHEIQECAICQNDLVKGTMVLPDCGHCFHEDCITRWLMIKYQCPLCKGNVKVCASESSPLLRQYSPIFGPQDGYRNV